MAAPVLLAIASIRLKDEIVENAYFTLYGSQRNAKEDNE